MDHVKHINGKPAAQTEITWLCERAIATRLAGLLAAACMLGMLVVAATPSASLAARAHAQSPSLSFGGPGTGAGSLSLATEPDAHSPGSGLAVNEASHDVYVADTGNRRVDELTATGTFVRAWGWGVATGAAAFEVCTTATTCRAGLSGSEPGEFETPSYIAVDNATGSPSHGDVYVADTANDLVSKFDAEGHLVSTWGNNGESASHKRTEPNGQLNGSPTETFNSGFAGITIVGIALDGSGALWVYNGHESLFEFDQNGASVLTCEARVPASPGAGGIAFDEGALLVHNGGGVVHQFEPQCSYKGELTLAEQPPVGEHEGIGSDTTDGDAYVVHQRASVEELPGGCVMAATSEFGECLPSQVFGEGVFGEATSLAVDSGSGAVYVGDAASDLVTRFPVVLEAAAAPAAGKTAHEAVLHGSVNPVGTGLSSCRFEYGFGPESEYTASVPCAESTGSIGSGVAAVPVEATVPGLLSGTKYHFRVRAVSPVGVVSSEPEPFTTAVTAEVRSVNVSGLTASAATLEAAIDPEGLEAHYHFEYGECPAGVCAGAPFTVIEPTAALSASATVSQPITGLTAGTTYHFRVLVSDSNGEPLSTPEGTFVVEPAAPACATARAAVDLGLADCRAYELATPPGKNGALIDNGAFPKQPSVAMDGSRIVMQSLQCFGDPSSCNALRQTEGTTYSFERAPKGWQATPLSPPVSNGYTPLTYNAATDDLLFAQMNSETGHEDFWAREADGTIRDIGPLKEAPGEAIGNIAPEIYAATAGLARVIYESGAPLWPSMSPSGQQIYTYPGLRVGRPDLVGVSGPAGSESLISACGTVTGAGKDPKARYGSLSADGDAVFFNAKQCPAGGTGENAGHEVPANTLYERVLGPAHAYTVRVSGPGPAGTCEGSCLTAAPRPAAFEGASTDGTNVFFTDTGRLTDEASQDTHSSDEANRECAHTGSSGCNLYEFVCPERCANESERKLLDVSAGDSSGVGPQVQGVVAIPPDGSDVYFVAHGVLTGANDAGEEPVAGLNNLYVYRAGPGGTPGHSMFIASLPDSDSAMWLEFSGIGIANVTPTGRYLVFTSHRALTSDATQMEGPAQVYRYDADTEELARVSIGQAGFNDNGNNATADAQIVEAFASFVNDDGPGSANPSVSDDGQIVVFRSPTGLTPGALNDASVIGNSKVLAENVYEWEAPGTQPAAGSPACSNPAGCISLISDGRDRYEGTDSYGNESATELLGIDPTGRNIFFFTADPVLPSDEDSQLDLYDARVEGGIAEPAAVEPCGTLEGCHGASAGGEPPAPLISSALFSGPGNLAPAPAVKPRPVVTVKKTVRCKRGFVKNKKNRCVKKSKRKARKAGHGGRAKS